MNRLIQAAFYSFLFTIFGASWYYLIGLAVTLGQGGDVKAFVWNTFVGSLICFGFFTYLFHSLLGLIEERNKRGRERRDEDKDDKGNPPRD